MRNKTRVGILVLVFAPLIAVAALIAYLQLADLSRYRALISQDLTQVLGRPVRIDGAVDLQILPHPGLSLTKIRLANAGWASHPDMLSADRLEMGVALYPLLFGELHILKFYLQGATARLEKNKQGAGNWQLKPRIEQGQVNVAKKNHVWPIAIDPGADVAIKDVSLFIKPAPDSRQQQFDITSATVQHTGTRGLLSVAVAGQIDGHAYQVAAKVGTLQELMQPDKRYPIELQASLLNTDIKIAGYINSSQWRQAKLMMDVSAANLAGWQSFWQSFAQPGLTIQDGSLPNTPLIFSGNLQSTPDSIDLSQLQLRTDLGSLDGQAQISSLMTQPRINAQLHVHKATLDPLFHASASARTKHTKPHPVDLSWLKAFDASFTLTADSIRFANREVEHLQSEINVTNGTLRLSDLSFDGPLGKAVIQADLTPAQQTYTAYLKVNADVLHLGPLFSPASNYTATATLDGEVQSQGKTWQALFDNLQGRAQAIYHNQDHGHQFTLTVVRLGSGDRSEPFDVTIDGQLKAIPYHITGEIGGPAALVSDQPYPVNAKLQFARITTTAHGSIAQLYKAHGFNLEMRAAAPDLIKLGKLLDINLPPLRAPQLSTRLLGDYNDLKFDKIDARTHRAQLSGYGELDFRPTKPHIGGSLIIGKLDLSEIGANPDVNGKNTPIAKVLDKPFSLNGLNSFNADISLKAKQSSAIDFPPLPITALKTQLSLNNGTLELSPLQLSTPVGDAVINAKVNAGQSVPAFHLRLSTKDLQLDQLPAAQRGRKFFQAKAQVAADLDTQGHSLLQWVQAVHGRATINYQRQAPEQTYAVRLTRAASPDNAKPVLTRINGKIQATLLQGDGSLGLPQTWIDTTLPTQFRLHAASKGIEARLDGKITNLINGEGLTAMLSVNGAATQQALSDNNALSTQLGLQTLKAHLTGDYSHLQLNDLNAGLSGGDVTGTARLDTAAEPVAMQVDLAVNDLDLSWLNKLNDHGKQARPDRKKRPFGDEPLPYTLLKKANIVATLNGNQIQFAHLKAEKIAAHLNVRDGKLQLNLDRFDAPDGALTGQLTMDANTDPPDLGLNIKVPRLNITELTRNTAAQGLIRGDFSADINMRGGGQTLNQWLATSNGHIRIVMDKGQIDSALLNLYTGGTQAMLGMLLTPKAKNAKVNCGICGLKINHGIASTEIAVLDTQYSTIVANGQIDFAKQTINIKASPVAKGVTLSVAVPVDIQGPLTHPNITTQKANAVLKAADYFALYTVPTAALFVAYDALRTEHENRCIGLVKPSDDILIKRAFVGLGKAVKDVASGFVKGLGTILGFESQSSDVGENQEDKADE